MGITRLFGRFFIILFCIFGAWLLLINLYSYSLGEDTYFGFRSFLNMLQDLPTLPTFDKNAILDFGEFTLPLYLPSILTRLYDDTIGVIAGLFSFGDNVDEYLFGIYKLITMPLGVFIDLFLIVISLIGDLVVIIPFIFNLIGGGYNLPLT